MLLHRLSLLLFLSFFFSTSVEALIEVSTERANAKYLMKWMQFEMGQGGTANITIDYNANVALPLRIYVCSPDEINVLLDTYNSIEQICGDFNNSGGCRAAIDANDGGLMQLGGGLPAPPVRSTWAATIMEDVMLQFYYLNCNAHPTEFVARYALLNPNGEQVGLGQIPLRHIFTAMTMVWSIASVLMLVTLLFWIFLAHAKVNKLHVSLFCTAVVGAFSSGMSSHYWNDFALKGKPDDGYQTLMDFGSGLLIVLVLLWSLLVSRGWKVVGSRTDLSVDSKDWRTIGLLFCIYGFTFAFYGVYGGTFFPLFMLIMCFFVLIRYAHSGIAEKRYEIRQQLVVMRDVLLMNPRGSPVLHQFQAMTMCGKVLPSLLMGHLVIRLWDMTRDIHCQPEWLMMLFHNLWMFSVVVFLFVNFRVRGRNQWSPSAAAALDVRASLTEQNDGLSSSLPKNKPEAFQKAFFVVSGWKINGTEEEEDKDDNDRSSGDQKEYELRMTSSLKNNPKFLTLATEPWCVSPGTFVMEETTEVTAEEAEAAEEVAEEEKTTEIVVNVGSSRQVGRGGRDGIREGTSAGETKETLEIDI